MNQKPFEPASQDVLDRATAALRNTDVLETPSREEMADGWLGSTNRSPQASDDGDLATARLQPLRFVTKVLKRAKRYSKPGLVTAAVVICGMVGWFLTGHSRVVFADALQKLRESQTISFRSTINGEGLPVVVVRQTMAAPGFFRMRMQMNGKDAGIGIFDGQASAGIMLLPATKQAIQMTSADDLPDQTARSREFIEWLKTTRDHATEDLGPRKIDGAATFGFRVEKEGQSWDVWVDLQSSLPARMESQFDIAGLSAAIVMDEFIFDEELHPSLFSLTPPPGYTVTQELEVREPGEDDVVNFLRRVAELSDDTFPADLEMQTLMELLKAQPKTQQMPSQKELLQQTLVITRALMFLKMNGATYTGSGVKLGEAGSILCWWTPKDKETFRAVYADLSIRDGGTKEPPSSH